MKVVNPSGKTKLDLPVLGEEKKEFSDEITISRTEVERLRRSEEHLKTQNARLQHIFNTLDNSYWGIEVKDFKILYASPGNEKIYGYSDSDFQSNPRLWYEVIISEDKPIAKQVISDITNGLSVIARFRIIHKSGDTKWIEVRATPTLDETGSIILVDGITHDITSLKWAEQNMKINEQRLLEAQKIARVGDFTYDFATGIWQCSAMVDEITGLSTQDIMVFDKWIALISVDVKAEIIDKIYPLIQKGTMPSGHYIDCKINRANDGEERWVSIMGNIEYNRDGNPMRLKGAVQDITERKKAEDEIKRLNESLEHKVEERTIELKQANRELEAFNYTVSHDLQNPLRSLRGFSNLLLKDYSHKLDDDGREFITIIDNNAKRMSALISDLLAFAKLGKIEVAKVKVDMYQLVRTQIDEIKLDYNHPAAEIVLHETAPAFCDPGLMKQVWSNLIGNAVKYSSKAEHAKIEIGSRLIHNEIVYYVKDNGVGFDMKDADKLFKVFERLHKAHDFEGTGIGLSTVERIIAKHGGRIWAESEVNNGATFYFTLPQLS